MSRRGACLKLLKSCRHCLLWRLCSSQVKPFLPSFYWPFFVHCCFRCEWLNIPYKINVASVEVTGYNSWLSFGIFHSQSNISGVRASGEHGPHQPGGGAHHPGHVRRHHLHHHRPLQVVRIVFNLYLGCTNLVFQESNTTKARLDKKQFTSVSAKNKLYKQSCCIYLRSYIATGVSTWRCIHAIW